MSNPFRKAVGASRDERFPPIEHLDSPRPTPSPQPLKTSLRGSPAPDGEDGKKKPVKKVRVLSPPPLSPDSPEWPFNAPPSHQGFPPELSEFEQQQSQFHMPVMNTMAVPPQPPQAPPPRMSAPPPTSFSKALEYQEAAKKEQELEKERKEEGAVLKAANAARGSLNVDAFQRLLMTGNTGLDGDTQGQKIETPERPSGTAPSGHDFLNASLALTKNDVTPGNEFADENEIESSDLSDTAVNTVTNKKPPPPPPSSRHGKSINVDHSSDHGEMSPPKPTSPSDVNKPLPQPPARNSMDDGPESPFDKEAAGKVPELDEPAPAPLSSTSSSAQRKPVPAPPPRRGHHRAESKAQPVDSSPAPDPSISRSESVRHSLHAPAPPPPRRFHGSNKPGTSPTAASFTSTSTKPDLDQSDTPSSDSATNIASAPVPKISAPPPPPARNTSVRRPPSIHSDSTPQIRTAGDKPGTGKPKAVPLPPPRRQRGSSKSSVEGPPRRSTDETDQPVDPGKGGDILADLDALRREVEALRGKAG